MLVRPGVEFDVRDGIVEVAGATLLVDRGTHVHDPWADAGPLQVASELGRPPFPRRPVVVFAATAADPALAEWSRLLVNRLVRRDIEARLALPTVATGLHLTRPCTPGAESVRALDPDVVIALDTDAAAQADAWCEGNRSTTVIELIDDPSITLELVSWQVGHASGRVRARISRRVDAPALAATVRRFCAGPQPVAPSDVTAAASARPVVREQWTDSGRARRTCVVVTGDLDAGAQAHVDGLHDHLEAAGVAVTEAPTARGIPDGATAATLTVLVGVDGAPGVNRLVEARRAAGSATVVDLRACDVAERSGPGGLALTPEAARMATACGMAISAGDAGHVAATAIGVRALMVPTMITRTRAAELRHAIGVRDPGPEAVIGWYTCSEGSTAAYLDAVADGLARLLADRADVRVELAGASDRVPSALRRHARVTQTTGWPEPEQVAGWSVHVFTPAIVDGVVAGDAGILAEAAYAAVPSILPLPARAASDGHGAADLTIANYDDPQAWTAALRPLLDDEPKRLHCAHEAARWSTAVHAPSAAKATANRFLGWALYNGSAE